MTIENEDSALTMDEAWKKHADMFKRPMGEFLDWAYEHISSDDMEAAVCEALGQREESVGFSRAALEMVSSERCDLGTGIACDQVFTSVLQQLLLRVAALEGEVAELKGKGRS